MRGGDGRRRHVGAALLLVTRRRLAQNNADDIIAVFLQPADAVFTNTAEIGRRAAGKEGEKVKTILL